MPQNEKLPAEWREMLGANWADIQRQWLHRLGNLTLTGYNSKYSDRPFAEKKTSAAVSRRVRSGSTNTFASKRSGRQCR